MAPGSKGYEEWLAQLEEMYHMNGGIISGFFAWMGEMFTGNFGDSWLYTVPVLQKFNETVWLSFVMGRHRLHSGDHHCHPLGRAGCHQAVQQDGLCHLHFCVGRISLPTFFFASLLKLVFSREAGLVRSVRSHRP